MSIRCRIAVVGAGAAGLTSAYLLQRRHDVVLYEKSDRIGGHVNSVTIPDGPDAGVAVDTGFIVYNDRNYPLFTRLLEQLGVTSRESDMSFGYYSEASGLQYAGTGLNGLFAQRTNLANPAFWRLLAAITLFCRRARAGLAADAIGRATIAEFLAACSFSESLKADYVLPMAGAIWSASRQDIGAFPAASILHFFDNHGLLDMRDRPTWRTISGGSHTYVRALLDRFDGQVRHSADIAGISRGETGATLRFADGRRETFDHVVIATHADQALALIDDPSEEEARLLGAWRYSKSHAVLHTDASVMPPNRRAWAAWNYRRTPGSLDEQPVFVSYHMNQLQGLETRRQYFTTLNPPAPIATDQVIAEIDYTHPCYEWPALETQEGLRALNGPHRTHYCGSYLGYGFHEDAVRSGVEVANNFGIEL